MGKRERVYGVVGYYDGVLDGVADCGGRPHSFDLHHDDGTAVPIYRLVPLSDDTMRLFEEAWQIWLRWEHDHPTHVGPDTVAALPQDRARHAEIEPLLKKLLAVPQETSVKKRGHFLRLPDADPERDGRWAMDVEWSEP